MMKYPKRMSSGQYIDLANFTIHDVSLEDIETSLNNIVRFDGHHGEVKPLTVAQHSLLCYNIAKIFFPEEYDVHYWALIHDFPEVYVGDLASPVKNLLGKAWEENIKPIEDTVEFALVGGILPFEVKEKGKIIDIASLNLERRCMWKDQSGGQNWPKDKIDLGEKASLLFYDVQDKYVEISKLAYAAYKDYNKNK